MVYKNLSTGALIGVWAFRDDSTRVGFMPNGAGFVSDPGVKSTLSKILAGDGTLLGWQLWTGKDVLETYSPSGQLLSIEALGGDKVTLSYAGERLTEVADRQGRKLTFSYALLASNALRLTALTLPDGREVRYEYDSGGYLWKVARPDATPTDWTDNPRRTYVYGEGTYGTAWRLTGLVDENGGRYSSWRYDSSGRATLSVHGEDTSYVDRVEIAYTSGTQSTIKEYTSATTFNSRTVNYALQDNVSRITSMSQACTNCQRSEKVLTYDANGNCDLVTDFANTVTDHDYNSRNLETKRTDAKSQGANSNLPEKRTTETDWHTAFRLPTERRVYNAAAVMETKTTYAYNSRGQVTSTSQIDPATSAARTTTYTYCEQADVDATGSTCPYLGLRKTIDGPRTDVSDVTTFAYYPSTDESGCDTGGTCHRKGDLHTVTNALGHVTENLRYDRAGRAVSIEDANGVVTDLEYSVRGWLARKLVRGTNGASETDDAITAFEYNAAGLVTKVTQPDGAYLTYAYDTAHRLTGIADNAGNTITYTLDAMGKRLQEDTRDPSGVLKRTLSRVYNTLGQMTALKNAAGVATATNTYDAGGNVNTVLDANGRTMDNDYDPLNRLKQTIQDVGGIAATTAYVYDARDNLRQVTDPKGLNTVYTYDGRNDLTQLSSPDTGVTAYTYDAAGNRASQTDARGVTTGYTYDALNRVTAITYPTSSLNIAFAYDSVGASCTTGNTFSVGRLTSITDHSGSTEYCYDRRGNVTGKKQVTTAPTGSGARTFTTAYAYTLADRLSSVTYPGGSIAAYTRNALGQITAVQYGGNSMVTAATYLPFGPVASLTYASGQTLTRTYDQNYWPTGVSSPVLAQHYALDDLGNLEALGPVAGVPAPSEHYVYDNLDRLKEVRDANQALIEAYAYDATGNRTSKTRGGATAAYGYPSNNHRLTSIGATARGYDANGNWTTTGGTAVHTFDDRNRLVASGNLAFDYNGLGQRVGVNERVFGYDESGQLLYELGDAAVVSPAPDRKFVWLDSVPIGYVDTGTSYYVHADHLNTPRVATTTTGTAVWAWAFQGNPFGENAANEDVDGNLTALGYPLRFPGQYDDGDGLHYNYSRDFESATGRYIESDAIGLLGGLNTFGYGDASPLMKVDPAGEAAFALPLICAAGGCETAAYCITALIGLGTAAVIVKANESPVVPANNTEECGDDNTMCMAKGGKQNKANEYSRAASEHPDPCEWLRQRYKAARASRDFVAAQKIKTAQKALGCRHIGGD